MKEYAILIIFVATAMCLALKGCDSPSYSKTVQHQFDSNTARMNEALTKLEGSVEKLTVEVNKLEGAVSRVVVQ